MAKGSGSGGRAAQSLPPVTNIRDPNNPRRGIPEIPKGQQRALTYMLNNDLVGKGEVQIGRGRFAPRYAVTALGNDKYRARVSVWQRGGIIQAVGDPMRWQTYTHEFSVVRG